jgi:hypothetical protein
VTVLDGGVAVGFMVLDCDPPFSAVARALQTLGVRAFFVDRDDQGRGVGTVAQHALPADVGALSRRPRSRADGQRRQHRRGASRFHDAGRFDHSRPHGPQHVLLLAL